MSHPQNSTGICDKKALLIWIYKGNENICQFGGVHHRIYNENISTNDTQIIYILQFVIDLDVLQLISFEINEINRIFFSNIINWTWWFSFFYITLPTAVIRIAEVHPHPTPLQWHIYVVTFSQHIGKSCNLHFPSQCHGRNMALYYS